MNEKLVSAIITTKNRKESLIKAVDSIINQTYKNIEIIVVDDGSTENLIDYFKKEYSEVKYIYIPNNESLGGNHARNVGILNARGELIAFLDDDDEWLDTKIEKQCKLYEQNPSLSYVACGRINVYNHKKSIYEDENRFVEGDLSKEIFTKIPYNTSSIMTKKKNLETIGCFDERLKAWQDYDLQIRLCQIGNVGVIKECLIVYNISSDDKNRITNTFDNFNNSIEYFEEKHKGLIDELPINYRNKHFAMICLEKAKRSGRTGNKKNQRKYLKELLKYDRSIKNIIKYVFNISKRRW